MIGARRWTVFVSACACALLITESVNLRAQGARRTFSGLQKYSEVTLSDLPGGAHRLNAPRVTPFHATDEESLSRHKRSDALVVAPVGSSVTVPSTVAIDDAGFEGINLSTAGAIPPDTQIAVGPNHVMEAVNSEIRIWSRPTTTPTVQYDVDLGTFFGLSIFDFFTVISDPRVIYDPVSDRWFASCVTLDPYLTYVGAWRIAVSKSNNPTGAYTLYQAQFNGEFPDFPSLGLSDDKLALTGNAFGLPSMQFLGSEFLVANKADLVAGVSNPVSSYYGHPQAVDTIQAAKSLSSTSKLYLAAVPADGGSATLQIWSIDGVPGVGPGAVVTTQSLTLAAPLVVPPDAVQPGLVRIMTNDTRLQDLVYRDGHLWISGNTGCTPSGSATTRACLHFAEVDTVTMSVVQEITYGEADVDYYYPAVTTDAAGNMVSVFTRSSGAEYPSVYTSGHNASDAAGAFQTPLLVHAGASSYDADPYDQRWGDYEGIAVDPFDGGATVWLAGQLMGAGGGLNWTTWIAQVSTGAGGCQLPSTPTGLAAAAADARVTLTWSTSNGASTYNVKRSTTSGGPYTNIATDLTTSSYPDTAVINDTTYYYVVSGVNTCGETGNSAQVSATPTALQPVAAPTSLKATGAKRKVMLSWTQSTSTGITQNKIYRSTSSGGGFVNIATIGANTGYTDTQVVSGTTYYYAVTALRGTQESVLSTQASAKAK